jgi:hypothetical protein
MKNIRTIRTLPNYSQLKKRRNTSHNDKPFDPPPPHFTSLRLPRGDILLYPTGRPNIRVLTRQIRALGYSTWDLHVDISGFQQQQLPKAVWLHAVVLGRVILFIADPAERLRRGGRREGE